MTTLKVMVTGSRDWPYPRTIHRQLDIALEEANQPFTLIHGDCPTGADRIASLYTQHQLNLPQIRYPANWTLFGSAAGPIRNKIMIESEPHLVLAFQWDNSRGTQNAITLAQQNSIPTRIFTGES